jgi:hypothetical protein
MGRIDRPDRSLGAAHPHAAGPDPNRLRAAGRPDDLHDPAALIDAGEPPAVAAGTATHHPHAGGVDGDRFGADR